MTTEATSRKAGPFLGNDATTSFPFDFKVFVKTDIALTLTNSAGADTLLTLDSDYSVTLNADQDNNPGGSITYPLSGSPLPTGSKLTAIGDLPVKQGTDITNLGRYQAQVIEAALDYQNILVQQHEERMGRALSVPVGSTASTEVTPQANQILGWNSTATALESIDPLQIANLAAYGTTSPHLVVESVAALRAASKAQYSHAIVTGYTTQGDGGGAIYYLDEADTASLDNRHTTIIADDGGVWKKLRTLKELRRYQVAPNKTILAPDGSRFQIRGVSMFDYLFVSNETRTDYTYRTIYSPTGKGPGTGISEPTYYARLAYKSAAYVKAQLEAARAMGINLIRVGVEPAMLKASVSYVDPSDGLTYPSDMEMLDEIVRQAGLLGMVAQLHNAQDMCVDTDNAEFLTHLALRYWDNPWVWLCVLNEPFAVQAGGAYVNDAAKWKLRHDTFMPAVRNTLANGQKFLNPVIINPPDYAHNLDGIAATLNSDTAFTLDPNLIVGIHVYAVAGQSDFRTTRLAADTTAWYQYLDTYCIFIDEHGIDNYAGRYDPNLDPGTPSVDLAEWTRMQQFSTDFCQWAWERSTLHNMNGLTGLRWFGYVPGLATHDDNTMFLQDGTLTTWGSIFKFYFSSHSQSSAAFRRSLGAQFPDATWGTGDIGDETITPSKLSLPLAAFTPVLTATSGAITSYTATGSYLQVGKVLFVSIDVTITNNGTGAGKLNVTLPSGFGNVVTSTMMSAANIGSSAVLFARALSGTTTAELTTTAGAYPGGTGAHITVNGWVQIP